MPSSTKKNEKKIFFIFSSVSVFLITLTSVFYIDFDFVEFRFNYEKLDQIESKNSNFTPSLINYLNQLNYFNKNESFFNTNSYCQIPDLDIWDPSIRHLIRPVPKYNKCVQHSPLTLLTPNKTLFIDQNINVTNYDGKIRRCEYAAVLRDTVKNDNYKLGDYKMLAGSDLVSDDFIKVRCFVKEKIVYEYVHAVLNIEKIEFDEKLDTEEKLNVLILAFDGVSHSSFKRSLPKTFKYLQSLENFFLFRKHNVVGENTFKNIVPFLTNLEPETLLKKEKYEKIVPPFDDFPFVWKNFSERGYLTYFSEEWRESTFNNLKFGFKNSPTDYYLRPYWLSLYDSLSYPSTNLNSNPKPCYFDKLLHMLTFDWLREFHAKYTNSPNTTNSFGFMIVNEMSHDYLERLFWIDDDLLALLQDLFTETFLDKTLFIIMGDHGHRQHQIRQTSVGKTEEKLPFFGMIAPRLLLEKNVFLHETLTKNTHELTTWWDLHETLVHLLLDQSNMDLDRSDYIKNKIERAENMKNGFSLFLPVPSRDCNEAKIPEQLCSCDQAVNIGLKEEVVVDGAEFLVDYINNVLLKEHKDKCAELNLKSIQMAKKFTNNINKFSLIFTTNPNNATFDATFIKDKNYELVGAISRISLYGLTSRCIENYFLKNYCYCI